MDQSATDKHEPIGTRAASASRTRTEVHRPSLLFLLEPWTRNHGAKRTWGFSLVGSNPGLCRSDLDSCVRVVSMERIFQP